MSGVKVHGDDTPLPVLTPGNGKTKTGRLWTYVRDDGPAGDTAAPAVWFAYSPDRKGEHPWLHLQTFNGTLQAEAYAAARSLRRRLRAVQAVLRGFDSLPGSVLAARRLEQGGVYASLFELRRALPQRMSRLHRQRSCQPRRSSQIPSRQGLAMADPKHSQRPGIVLQQACFNRMAIREGVERRQNGDAPPCAIATAARPAALRSLRKACRAFANLRCKVSDASPYRYRCRYRVEGQALSTAPLRYACGGTRGIRGPGISAQRGSRQRPDSVVG